MSADSRSVATDALETLGTILGDGVARDAIHLAVEPVEAGESLSPGEHIHLRGGKAYGNTGATGLKLLGIVDPFLKSKVKPGQRFWLVVYPRQITSLRHVWTHPEFPAIPEQAGANSSKAESEQWLRDFCDRADCPGYDAVMQGIQGLFRGGSGDYDGGGYVDSSCLHFNGCDAHGEIPAEFWIHAEIVLGKKLDTRPEYFSCSC
jgi:hypothetical protein